jgi:hypothetical protein
MSISRDARLESASQFQRLVMGTESALRGPRRTTRRQFWPRLARGTDHTDSIARWSSSWSESVETRKTIGPTSRAHGSLGAIPRYDLGITIFADPERIVCVRLASGTTPQDSSSSPALGRPRDDSPPLHLGQRVWSSQLCLLPRLR